MGTWIEISIDIRQPTFTSVVPLVGTWIEIRCIVNDLFEFIVVPLVGTWIEITKVTYRCCTDISRSPRGNVD